MSQMERLYWFDALIREHRYPHWDRIVETFDVSRRTAMNDIAYLRDRLDAPIAFHSGHNGYYYTEPTYSLPFLALTVKEANALRQSLLSAGSYLPEQDTILLRQLAVKLSPYLRGLPRHDIAPPEGHEIFTGQVALSPEVIIPEELLRDVRTALDQRQRLTITYAGAHSGEITNRSILPYTLLNWRGELYLIAFCELRQGMRDFFLPRIREWQLLPEHAAYTIPSTFDIQAYLKEAFLMQRGGEVVTVRLHFSARQATWIRERRYHTSQENDSQSDGSLMITLRVAVTDDLKRWILGYGAEVEVIEPQTLRQDIQKELTRWQENIPILQKFDECNHTALRYVSIGFAILAMP